MSTSVGTVGSSASAPVNVTGLASGLNTNEIISALLAVEREPITRMDNEETRAEAQRAELQTLQSALTALASSAQELESPTLFNDTQTVTSSNSAQIAASTSSGAAVGGYEVEVTQLANSAQRTFSFSSPAAAQTLTIDGVEFTLAAGESAQEFADAINASSQATVYAAAVNGETLVLSSRATGATGSEFIKVSDPGEALVEQAGLAKEGRDAKYVVDGVEGSSASNTVSGAIPGVTLSLQALTSATGPVTIEVQPPAPSTSAIAERVKSFVSLYNSTIGEIETQLNTKPSTDPQTAAEYKTGTLFGDSDLMGLLNTLRQSIYEPVAGVSGELSSLTDIGVSTGPPTGSGAYSQTAVEGQLQINEGELESALKNDPASVQKLLLGFSEAFKTAVNREAGPGGNMELRIDGDNEQLTQLRTRVTQMNEMVAIRQKTLQEQYAEMEKLISQSQSESSWLSSQLASLESDTSSSDSTKS